MRCSCLTSSLRKLPSQAKVRSTFHRFLYRRMVRPSSLNRFLTRFLRLGMIGLIPRRCMSIRKAVLSYALSAINRFGRFRGLPGPSRGTLISSISGGASFTSAGDAEASWPPRGTPLPSTTTIHFVPLPRLVLPTHSPLF